MQFFILVVINIFMWVIFYLVISLKLEKSASEFREKKLRKIMDEIMVEFNSIAERNISILEKRISYLKKLLDKSGGMGGVDIICHDPMDGNKNVPKKGDENFSEELHDSAESGNIINPIGFDFLDRMKETSKACLDKAKSLLSKSEGDIASDILDNSNNKIIKSFSLKDEIKSSENYRHDENYTVNFKIDEEGASDYVNGKIILEGNVKKEEEKLSKEEINDLFGKTTDKYSLIRDLHKNGFLAEDISKYSGIPIGEIKLVLNLRGN